MRLVVDSNCLQSDDLQDFLSKSKKNVAVLTDYAAMEAYKGKTLSKIYKSMSLLADFPEQVIVLKSTRIICGLSGKRSRLQKRFIDISQTKGFSQYCRHLKMAAKGNKGLQCQLLSLGKEATQHLEKMLNEAPAIAQSIDEITKTFSSDELRYLRTGELLPNDSKMIKKMLESILQMAITLLENHPNVNKWPSRDELTNTLIFRVALCGYLLALDWISAGGAQRVRASKLRNDMVDVNFAAYATFFDGLMTNDKKADRIFRTANTFLKGIQ